MVAKPAQSSIPEQCEISTTSRRDEFDLKYRTGRPNKRISSASDSQGSDFGALDTENPGPCLWELPQGAIGAAEVLWHLLVTL